MLFGILRRMRVVDGTRSSSNEATSISLAGELLRKGELERLHDGAGVLAPELLPGVVVPSDLGVGHCAAFLKDRVVVSEKPFLEL